MKVEVAGKLLREDEKKEEDDSSAPAWRTTRAPAPAADLNEKKYPTLAKAVGQSSNINIDDGSQPTINIKTTKNVFASLANEEDDEDAGPRRPKEIKPAMVQKRQGEKEAAAIQREVDKYGGAPKKGGDEGKKEKSKKKKEDSDEEDEESEEEDEEAKELAREEAKKKKRK